MGEAIFTGVDLIRIDRARQFLDERGQEALRRAAAAIITATPAEGGEGLPPAEPAPTVESDYPGNAFGAYKHPSGSRWARTAEERLNDRDILDIWTGAGVLNRHPEVLPELGK